MQFSVSGHNIIYKRVAFNERYGDSVVNTLQENFSVFSLIRMRWLPSGSKNLHQQNPPFLTRGAN